MASCSAAVAVCANARDPSSAPATPAARPNNRRRVIRDQCIVPGPRSVPNILRSPEDTPLPYLARHVQPVVRGSAAAATAIRGWGGIAPCIQVPQEKSGRIAAGLDRFRWGGGTSWSPSYYKYLVDGVASGRVARYLGHDSWRGGRSAMAPSCDDRRSRTGRRSSSGLSRRPSCRLRSSSIRPSKRHVVACLETIDRVSDEKSSAAPECGGRPMNGMQRTGQESLGADVNEGEAYDAADQPLDRRIPARATRSRHGHPTAA